MKATAHSRLLSLDVLRGITIAGMILVNNSGNFNKTYAPLKHVVWEGLTPTDLVFPFFMFIMGVSMYLSYSKFNFRFSRRTFIKLSRRAILLFLIGLLLNWLGLFFRGLNEISGENISLLQKISRAALSLENLRILGVLQRLALVSFFGSLIILLIKRRFIPWVAAGILILYWIIIAATDSFLPTENNIIAVVDKAVLGSSHMLKINIEGTRIAFDPEGLLSTLPCIAHVLLGFIAGRYIAESDVNDGKTQKLFIFGTILLFSGYFIQYGFPIIKKIWTSSFVLITCGLASLLLALLIWIIDIKEKKRWSIFFQSFGVNPMIIYVFAGILATFMNGIHFNIGGEFFSIRGIIYNYICMPLFGEYLGALVYALIFVMICWLFGNFLYKKKIYIKL